MAKGNYRVWPLDYDFKSSGEGGLHWEGGVWVKTWEGEGMSCVAMWEARVLEGGTSQCEGSEAEACLVWPECMNKNSRRQCQGGKRDRGESGGSRLGSHWKGPVLLLSEKGTTGGWWAEEWHDLTFSQDDTGPRVRTDHSNGGGRRLLQSSRVERMMAWTMVVTSCIYSAGGANRISWQIWCRMSEIKRSRGLCWGIWPKQLDLILVEEKIMDGQVLPRTC